MASTSSRIRVIFDGDASGIERASAAARLAVSGVSKSFGGLMTASKGLAVLGAAGGAVQAIAGVAAAAQQLAPAVLLLPAALLAAGAAFATFKIATSGFGDALKGDAEALAKLSPSARATVDALNELKAPFQEIKSLVQENFFKGFSGEVKDLGGTYLPILKQALPGIATQFNDMGHGIAFALKQAPAQEAITKVLGNTTTALGNMRQSLGHVTSGFVSLAGVGSDFLPRLGTAIDGVASKFKVWVDQGIASGKIESFINNAIQGFKDLGAVVGNIGSIIGSVFSGLAGEGGGSPLASLRALTAALADFFKSAEAQGPLQALGETLRVVAGVVKDVLLAALKAVAPIVEALAPIVQELARVVGDILTSAFEQLGPPIEHLIQRLQPVLIPLLDFIAQVIIDVVIPALAAFIDWLVTHIDDIHLFAEESVISFLSIASAVLGFVSGFLGGMEKVFATLSLLPGSFGEAMGKAADTTAFAKRGVDDLRGTVDLLHAKTVEIHANTIGQVAIQQMLDTIDSLPTNKTIYLDVVANSNFNASQLGGVLHRATGGPVSGGRTYLVGERGPEIVTMGASGFVTPNNRLGGGGGDTYVTVKIGDQELRGIVQTEVKNRDRATQRAVYAGASA